MMIPKYTADAVRAPSMKEFPEYLALVTTGHKKKAYALRLKESLKVVSKKRIDTGDLHEVLEPFRVRLYNSVRDVCDAAYAMNFYVRLGNGQEKYHDVRLSFLIDEDPVFPKTPIRDLREKEIVFSDPGEKFCLFPACAIDEEVALASFGNRRTLEVGEGAVNRSEFLGYMIPNGTTFEVELEGVPGGGGLVDLEVGFDLPEYTTRGFEKSREVS